MHVSKIFYLAIFLNKINHILCCFPVISLAQQYSYNNAYTYGHKMGTYTVTQAQLVSLLAGWLICCYCCIFNASVRWCLSWVPTHIATMTGNMHSNKKQQHSISNNKMGYHNAALHNAAMQDWTQHSKVWL